MSDEEIKTLYNIVDKLEKRIFLLEKVIGKLQLRLGDVVLYIDKKAEQDEWFKIVSRTKLSSIHYPEQT